MILLESCNIHYTQVVPHYAKCQSRNAGHMDRGTRSANNNSEHFQHTLSFSLCHRSLPGINPTLPERLTGKQESKTEGMEGGRKKPRSRAYFPFTALQTLLTMSSRFSSISSGRCCDLFLQHICRWSIWYDHHYCFHGGKWCSVALNMFLTTSWSPC